MQQQPETANATAQCDGRVIGINRNSVGVEKGVHTRQQVQLKAFRREGFRERIWKHNPIAKKIPEAVMAGVARLEEASLSFDVGDLRHNCSTLMHQQFRQPRQ